MKEIVMRKLQSVALAAALTATAAVGVAVSGATANAKTVTAEHVTHSAPASRGGSEAATAAAKYLTKDTEWHGGTVGTVAGRANVSGLFAGVVASLPNSHIVIQDIFGQ